MATLLSTKIQQFSVQWGIELSDWVLRGSKYASKCYLLKIAVQDVSMHNTTKSLRPPKLSKLGIDLLHVTRWQRTRAIAWPFVAFIAYWICAWFGHWVPAVFCLMVLSFVTYGSTSHDLVHGSLGLKQLPSELFLSVIEVICLRSGHAYQAAHLNHHAKFPLDDDIEAEAARMSLTRALAEGIVFQFRVYGWALRNPRMRRNWIVAEGIAVAAIVLGSIAVLPWTVIPAVYVALMIIGSWTIPLITSYFPHCPEASDRLHQTRLFRGVLVRVIAFDHLYHLEHHLYPAVPHQNWPQLARRLDPWLEGAGIEPVRVSALPGGWIGRLTRSAGRTLCSASGCGFFSGSHSR